MAVWILLVNGVEKVEIYESYEAACEEREFFEARGDSVEMFCRTVIPKK